MTNILNDISEILLSIIIPCYNCADFIGETIDSLENQTCKDFEVICINDGSTDNTLDTLTAWQAKSQLEIKIINQKNAGVSTARNRGIDEAKGKYMLFLDSDDIYNKDFVKLMLENALQSGADTVYCKLGRKLKEIAEGEFSAVVPIMQSQNDAMYNLMYKMGEIGFYCYIYIKEILIKNNIRFDINTAHGEDREFNWKYLCKCNSILLIDVPLYGYRVNAQSASYKPITWQRIVNGLAWVKRVEQYLEDNNCEFSPTLKSYLYARLIWAYAKGLAAEKNKKLFLRFLTEFDVKEHMKCTARAKSIPVAFSSVLFLISPMLYYNLIAFAAKIKNKF